MHNTKNDEHVMSSQIALCNFLIKAQVEELYDEKAYDERCEFFEWLQVQTD